MATRNPCPHGLHRLDQHGVCSDCAGITRVLGAIDGRHRARTRAGKRFVPIEGANEPRRCSCGALATTKEKLSDLLRPWCDECRQTAPRAVGV